MRMHLKIKDIDRTGLLTRASLNAEAIRDYAELYRTKGKEALPAVEVYNDEDDHLYLADGFHRVAASLEAGFDTIICDVQKGDFKTALTAALKANTTHGMRRTNADKRQAMQAAWDNREQLFGTLKPIERDFVSVCYVSTGNAHNFIEKASLLKMSKMPEKRPETAAKSPELTELTDRFGLAIPGHLASVFDAKGLIKVTGLIRKARRFLRAAIKGNTPEFAALPGQRVDITLANALNELVAARPYCVCRMCRGMGCEACHQTGFLTKDPYDRLPAEFKAQNVTNVISSPISTTSTITEGKDCSNNSILTGESYI